MPDHSCTDLARVVVRLILVHDLILAQKRRRSHTIRLCGLLGTEPWRQWRQLIHVVAVALGGLV